MDQIKVKNLKAVDVADELSKAEFLSSNRKENELSALDEWEMALVGGGDPLVCW